MLASRYWHSLLWLLLPSLELLIGLIFNLGVRFIKKLSPFEQDAGEGTLDALSDLVIGLRGSGGGSTGCRWHRQISGFTQQRRG